MPHRDKEKGEAQKVKDAIDRFEHKQLSDLRKATPSRPLRTKLLNGIKSLTKVAGQPAKVWYDNTSAATTICST